MQSMETLLLACLSILAVETTMRLWPRWYDCGTERPRRRLARYLVIYPAVAAGIVLSQERLDAARLALLLVLAVIAALDLAYHHISLPFQAALVVLTVVVIGHGEEPVFRAIAGVAIGGIVIGAALLTGQVGLGDVTPLAAAGALAGEQTWLVLVLAAGLAVACSCLVDSKRFRLDLR